MELTQFIQFKAIAECGSITKAARNLHVSQPALSIMLRKLEEELDVRLFIRNNNRLALSPAGQIALSYINTVLSQLQLMQKDLSRYQRSGSNLHIGFCSKGIMWYLVPRFSAARPDIDLTTESYREQENNCDILFNYQCDALITSKKISAPEIECKPFLTDGHLLSVPGSHPLASFHGTCDELLKELGEEPIHYLEQTDDSFCQQFLAFFETQYPCVHIRKYEYTDYFLYNQKLNNTGIISITTELVKSFRDEGKDRVLIPLDDPALSIQYYLCYLRENKEKMKPLLCYLDAVK